ncbi:thioesterase II family protein [Bacillus sp. MN7755]
MEKIKLFCLPYAGGSASMYYQLKGYMHKIVDVIPIEYSGHGERISENYYASFKNMVDDIASKIIDYLDDDQFSILGYSMGSLVAFEVYYEILKRTGRKPLHLYFVANGPPEEKDNNLKVSNMSSDRVVENIRSLDGYDFLLEDKELLDLCVKNFEVDFKLYKEYKYTKKEEKCLSNISIIYSEEDNVDDNIFKWTKYTERFCNYKKMKGNHFFINTHIKELAKEINDTLLMELKYL